MKRLIHLTCLSMALMAYLPMSAQDNETDSLQQSDLAIIARSYGDSVVIRWAPSDYPVWSLANKNGYVLERWAPSDKMFKKIAGPFLPYSLQEWKANADTTDTYVTAAAQALHGKQMVDPTESDAMGRKLMAYEEQRGRLAFALLAAEFSTAAANGLGLRYVDKDVKEHKHFLYRVYIPGAGKDTARVFIDAKKVYQPKPVRQVKLEPQDGLINIIWNKPLNEDAFSGYYIEKSADGKNFERLNQRPYISSSSPDAIEDNINVYPDSVSDNEKTFYYRVIGITSFGDEGLPSETVSAQARDLTSPKPPALVTAQETNGQKVQINWQTDAIEPDHAGFYVLKCAEVNGEYKVISGKDPLRKKVRSFTDEHAWPHRPNFYIIMAVDDKGNQSKSIAAMALMYDDTPPATPTGLIGEVDSLGIVSLAWEVAPEPDLKGYRVYRANSENREFVQITSAPIPGNFYTDTINVKTLTKKVYYKIAAFDFNYNPSEYSEVLELERPDYIPPVKPLMKQARIVTDTVKLHWTPSSSADVDHHVLYKRKVGEEWKTLAMIDDTTSHYYDAEVSYDERYQYTVEAVDESNLYSGKSDEATILFRKSAVRTVSNLSGAFNKSQKSLQLSWEYDDSANCKFMIFKGANEKELDVYATVSGAEHDFEDEAFYKNDSGYTYAVKVLLSDGRESKLSAPFQVVFK